MDRRESGERATGRPNLSPESRVHERKRRRGGHGAHSRVRVYGARACVETGVGKGAPGGRVVARAESLRVRPPEMSRGHAAREGVATRMG